MNPYYCPKCSVSFPPGDRAEFESRHYIKCQNCLFVHYNNPKPVVTALIENDIGRILLARRGIEPSKGAWGMAGGFLAFGEDPAKAIKRELLEELSTEAHVENVVGVFNEFYENIGDRDQRLSLTVIVFKVSLPSLEKLSPADDVAEIGWFDDLPSPFAFPQQRTFLEQYLTQEKRLL